MTVRLLLMMLLAFAGSACGPSSRADDPPRESLDKFPRTPLTIEHGDTVHKFDVWIADTMRRRQQGLMFVKHVPPGNGMLFIFSPPQPVSMWMKNTLIPLDMLFIGENGKILRIAERTTPQSLKTIPSMGLAAAVLELAGGECARLGIEPGDRVVYEEFSRSSSAPRN